jgi:hypothetical protein
MGVVMTLLPICEELNSICSQRAPVMIVLATGRNYAAVRCGPCHALKIASRRRFLRVLSLSVMYAAGSGAHGRLGKSDRISGKFDYVKLLNWAGNLPECPLVLDGIGSSVPADLSDEPKRTASPPEFDSRHGRQVDFTRL